MLIITCDIFVVATEVLKPPGMEALPFLCFFFVVLALVVTCVLQKLWLVPCSAVSVVLLEDLVSYYQQLSNSIF